MHKLQVEPHIILGKDDAGFEIRIDVALLLATYYPLHEAMAEALRRYFANGGVSSDVIRIRIIVSDEEDTSSTSITPRENTIDLESYSPDQEEILLRRMSP